jgi:hypothetical protein
LLAAKASQLDKILNHKLEELRMSKIFIVENQFRLEERITAYLDVRFREDCYFYFFFFHFKK